jgi:hypothetical protein
MSIREHKIAEGGTAHLPPGSLRAVRGPEGEGAGTIHENRSGSDFHELSYTAGDAPFIEGPVTSVAGACVWVDL